MKSHFLVSTLLFATWGAIQSPSAASPVVVLEARGDVTRPQRLTLAQLQKLAPAQTIKATLKGKPYTARGIALWALVEAASPKLDSKSKHSEARFVVLARGKDGYLASFAWPELSPDVGNKGAFVVWEANGKPLSGKEGPLRLIVPDEEKPMRWVYNLAAVVMTANYWQRTCRGDKAPACP